MSQHPTYPLKFQPILKSIIWGGSAICPFKGLKDKLTGIGESWEISCVPGSLSVVANGEYTGKTLVELIESHPEAILGKTNTKRFGHQFPLLVKFIDANDDLSIQVHPNDDLAMRRHQSFGKSEMWYVIGAKPGARLISGFSRQITAAEYEQRIESNQIEEVLMKHPVQAGDVFYIPAGRVHSIGAGILVAEIQQTSDITYRLYDFNRTGVDGKPRELHTELAKEAIDYQLYDEMKVTYTPLKNEPVRLVSCPYFTTNYIELSASDNQLVGLDKDYSSLDSFVILVCMKGEGILQYGREATLTVKQGESVLLPASMQHVSLTTTTELLLLETYITE